MSKFFFLLALALPTASLRAEENGGTAVAEAPGAQEAAVIVSDDPTVIARVQRDVVRHANETGASVDRITLEGPTFEALPPEVAAPLTTDGNSTASPRHAEDLANAMDAERGRQVERYKTGERILVAVRTAVVGGITSYTMTIGALNSHASPETVTAAAAIGLGVGGAYSYGLHKANPWLMNWQATEGYLSTDAKTNPAKKLVPRLIKQAMVPVGLATAMQLTKLAADHFAPGVDFNGFWNQPGTVALSTAAMAGTSVWFQFPWQRENGDRRKEELAAVGSDSVGVARAEFNSKRRSALISGLLSITNSLQLSGSSVLGASAALAVGVAGHAQRYLTGRYSTKPGATEPQRGLASQGDEQAVETETKSLPAKIGGVCASGYAALKAATTRTLASVRRP